MFPEILVEFSLIGTDFDPDEITRELKIQPEKTWRKGDIIKSTLLRRSCDCWCAFSIRAESLDLEELMRLLLKQIESIEGELPSICNRLKLSTDISCAVYIKDQTPAIHFSRSTIGKIERLGASLDIDLYFIGTAS